MGRPLHRLHTHAHAHARTPFMLEALSFAGDADARAAVAAESVDASTLAAAEALHTQLCAGRPWLALRGVDDAY